MALDKELWDLLSTLLLGHQVSEQTQCSPYDLCLNSSSKRFVMSLFVENIPVPFASARKNKIPLMDCTVNKIFALLVTI